MAAAEYYGSGARPSFGSSNSLQPSPQPQPQRAHSQPGYTYHPPQPGQPSPQLPAQHAQYGPPPPPYHPSTGEHKPRIHFPPSTSPLGQYTPPSPGQSRPEPYQTNQPNYHAQQLVPPQHGPGPFLPQPYTHQQQPNVYPAYWPGPGHASHDLGYENGYTSDPEPHRRKHKGRGRRISENTRSTDTDAFLGAAGGGLLGDLLFPGLGTVGGALFGWVGGKDYGKHRKWREEKRERDQERWEHKFGRSRSSRSRSHSRDRRRSSHDRRKRYD